MNIPRKRTWFVNIAKGTTEMRVEFISQVLTQILIKVQPKNLNQALATPQNFNFEILTKPRFRMSTKI